MIEIAIGTTPTITYSFNIVNPSDIVVAYMTIKVAGEIIIQKDLNEAIVEETTISWTLSQDDTLEIGKRHAKIMLNWVTSDGTRGVSEEKAICGVDNHIPEVI